jgi:hypothetical protein
LICDVIIVLREYAGKPANDDKAFTEFAQITSHFNERATPIVPGMDITDDTTSAAVNGSNGKGRVRFAEPMRLSHGFTHLPLSALVAQRSMRSFDRAILAEANSQHFADVINTSTHQPIISYHIDVVLTLTICDCVDVI